MEMLWQDLRYGFRMLVKSPVFTVVAVLTLAIGIGANTAIFSVIDTVLLRPLPYPDPNRLVMIYMRNLQPGGGWGWDGVSAADLIDWRAQNQVFEDMAAFLENLNLSVQGQPERIRGLRVSATLFPLLGVQPSLGRNFPGGRSARSSSSSSNQPRFVAASFLWRPKHSRTKADVESGKLHRRRNHATIWWLSF